MSSEAWRQLEEAALAHQRGNLETARPLADAAEAFALGRQQSSAARKAGGASGVVVPFGRSKGTAIEQCDVKDLRWVAAALAQSIDNPEKARWKEDNQRTLAAIQKELGTR